MGLVILQIMSRALLTVQTCAAHNPQCNSIWTSPLHPDKLPLLPVFSEWENTENRSVLLPAGPQEVAEGSLVDSNGDSTQFAVLPGAMPRHIVADIRNLLEDPKAMRDFDQDPDTVDGMPTYEVFVQDVIQESKDGSIKMDHSPQVLARRRPLREALKAKIHPVLVERVTPFIRKYYPKSCDRDDESRACTPCSILIRRYLPGERRSHGSHYDGHALVTVVISLADYDTDYTGGLYVGTGHGENARRVVALSKGDAVVHRSDLLHGVKVESGTRWSLIIWYRDSTTCQNHDKEWFKDCAEEGRAVCQQLYGSKIGEPAKMLHWNMLAAEGGSVISQIKIGRAYMGQLPSNLPFSPKKAAALYMRATELAGAPDAHYALGQMLLDGHIRAKEDKVAEAVGHFEAAAYLGHAYAAYNLGVAHLFGFGVKTRDKDLASLWFEVCGLPEGFMGVAMHRAGKGDKKGRKNWERRAKTMGFGTPWRKRARLATGSGGAGGVDLHSNWPIKRGGPKPPRW